MRNCWNSLGIAPLYNSWGPSATFTIVKSCPCQIARIAPLLLNCPLPIAKLPIAILLLKGIAPLTIVGTGRTAGIYYCQMPIAKLPIAKLPIAYCDIAHCHIAP
ncbi:MAG: hypothetical protein IPL23_29860 [Saprospiraceae bacterium]|nr:hypothetical protein [Saprospiraceae bacterium]